jgi:hypothetical protein
MKKGRNMIRKGLELTELTKDGVKAFTNTGFDPDNPQHVKGSDIVRWAITIQQLRDDRNYANADKKRLEVINLGYTVMQAKDHVRIKHTGMPWEYFKTTDAIVVDNIMYDNS